MLKNKNGAVPSWSGAVFYLRFKDMRVRMFYSVAVLYTNTINATQKRILSIFIKFVGVFRVKSVSGGLGKPLIYKWLKNICVKAECDFLDHARLLRFT